MKVIVTIEKDVTHWFDDEEIKTMSDDKIIEELQNDVWKVSSNAKWTIKKEE